MTGAQFQAGIVHTGAVSRPAVDPDPPTAAPDWLDELPLTPGPPWLSMGVHPLDLDDWLVFDEDAPAQLALKRQLLAEHHQEVFAARAGSAAAGAEVLELIRAWLTAHPSLIAATQPGRRRCIRWTRQAGSCRRICACSCPPTGGTCSRRRRCASRRIGA